MRRYRALLAALLLAALPVTAQEAEEDGGTFLEGLLERNLSGAGRDVRITGFAGALSSRATLEEMTISDAEGVWLTLRGAELDWNRGALVRGRLEVQALTAETLVIARRPVPEDGALPSAAAGGFGLPELPVAVQIGQLAVGRVSLGPSVLGTPVELEVDGGLSLAGGAGAARLAVTRLDGPAGAVSLNASFANDTRQLDLALSVQEEAGGIAAELLKVPGAPSLDFSVAGAGPLSDFTADVSLATDGTVRLAGQVVLAAEGEAQGFAADLAGDLAPLFAPEFRGFFGDRVALVARGARDADGGTVLDRLTLDSASLSLSGRGRLAPDGLPERLALTGRIADPEGGRVRLPLAGDPTEIDRATLDLTFDAAAGEAWAGEVRAEGVTRAGVAADVLALTGTGRIARGAAGRVVTADLAFDGRGLRLPDPRLVAALGDRAEGAVRLAWTEGAPLRIDGLRLAAAGLEATGDGTLGGVADGMILAGAARASVADLAAFAALAGRDLAGSGTLDLSGNGSLLGGSFDLALEARARDLALGLGRADRLWQGDSTLSLRAARDGGGTRVEIFRIDAERASATLRGTLTDTGGDVALTARLADLADLAPGASGPAALDVTASRDGGPWRLDLSASGPGGADATVAGTIGGLPAAPEFDGEIAARADSLAPYGVLAGRPLAGAVTLRASGAASATAADMALEATTRGLKTGAAQADRLLAGAGRMAGQVLWDGATLTLERAEAETAALRLSADGRLGGPGDTLRLTGRLADLGLFAPDIPGPASAEATLSRSGGDWALRLQGTGPAGTMLRAAGTVAGDFARADMDLAGQVPLGLVNDRIAPNSVRGMLGFDLRLSGPPGLASLSGRLSTADARIVGAAQGIALSDVDLRATLSGARAELSASAAVDRGGRVTVTGPVTLQPPFAGSLAAVLQGVVLTDPELFTTTANGRLTIDGPLTGGALIAGAVTLGTTEVQVPSSSVSATGPIPVITHVNEPDAVRDTRGRARLIPGVNGARRGGGPGYSLDLTVSAPTRIFIRGRGIDAELGGQVRLTGTTRDVLPAGQFALIRGRLDILGQRLRLTEGEAQLQGAFSPYLRLVAQAEAGEYTVFVTLSGPADAPEITFRSTPELPEDEVLAQLLFGRSLTELSALQAARLAVAVAELAGVGGLDILGSLRGIAGLADLDVTTTESGGTAVTAGAYLGENVYTDVTVQDGSTEINLNLDLSPSVTARGSVNTKGETGLGIFFERDY